MVRCDTELELLEKFLEIMQRSDPDILIGYDCGFQFDVLMSKIFALKVKNWSCVGKLRRLTPPYFKVCTFTFFFGPMFVRFLLVFKKMSFSFVKYLFVNSVSNSFGGLLFM